MDDELERGSTPPMGSTPLGQNSRDWNTALAGPAPEAEQSLTSADQRSPEPTDSRRRGKPQPEWREPSQLPAVQRAHTGTFGHKLGALAAAAQTVREVMASIDADALSDSEAVALTQTVELVGRPVDAARVTAATVISYRSRKGLGTDSLAWRMGTSYDSDLLTRLTRASAAEMRRRVNLGEKVCRRVLGAAVLEPVFPVVAAALAAGELGVEAASHIVKGLADYSAHGRFDTDPEQVDRAETALVEQATGAVYGRASGSITPDWSDPVTRLGDSNVSRSPADGTHDAVPVWQAFLNPDGVAPQEATLEAKSTFSFGRRRDGLYPIHGGVTPELKGIFQALFNTYLSARSAPEFPSAEEQERLEAGELVPGDVTDERTGGEKRADILRGILTQVAQDPRTPTMGGMPPTVMVHVNAADLLQGIGVGWIDGVEGPVSMTSINQMIDNGGMQPIFFGSAGAILGLGSKARCFTPVQRKAITARDGGCIIPGCTCPPQWTEVHHVVPWAQGGKTHVDNGVLLCWYHHHTINTAGWAIRMVEGLPQIKSPSWADPGGTWRAAESHRAHDPRTRPPRE